MIERELFERCKALGISMPWFDARTTADAHAILISRLAAKVREKHLVAYVCPTARGTFAAYTTVCEHESTTEPKAWLLLAEKVCGKAESEKPTETAAQRRGRHVLEAEAASDAKNAAAVERVRAAEFEAECRELWREQAIQSSGRGAVEEADEIVAEYRKRFGQNGGDA